MIVAVSDAETIAIVVSAAVVLLGLLALARILLRKEPAPWRWHRFRVGVFLERDTNNGPDRKERGDDPPRT